jgi:hypothetical protein
MKHLNADWLFPLFLTNWVLTLIYQCQSAHLRTKTWQRVTATKQINFKYKVGQGQSLLVLTSLYFSCHISSKMVYCQHVFRIKCLTCEWSMLCYNCILCLSAAHNTLALCLITENFIMYSSISFPVLVVWTTVGRYMDCLWLQIFQKYTILIYM